MVLSDSPTHALIFLVLLDSWLAMDNGSLTVMARYLFWFSFIYGLLFLMVLFLVWLASSCGSLLIMARYS